MLQREDTSQGDLTVTSVDLHTVSEYINSPNLHSLGGIVLAILKGAITNFY